MDRRDHEPDAADRELKQVVQHNVEAIGEIRTRGHGALNKQERWLAALIHVIGRPLTLYAILAYAVLWVGANLVLRATGHAPFDPPPFSGLQTTLAFCALVFTVIILIGQNRQGRIDEHRSELALQLNLLMEERTARMMQALQELRRDLPSIEALDDVRVEALARSADPCTMVEIIEDELSRADAEAGVRSTFSNRRNSGRGHAGAAAEESEAHDA